jgi:hypothetical protein
VRVGVIAALALVTALAGACSSDPKPYYPPSAAESAPGTEYDASLEASAAVLPLIPQDATVLEVTDFDQLRLVLGFGELDGESPASDRARFWSEVGDAATFSGGLLRPDDQRLRADFGFGEDDVSWEAQYGDGDPSSWIIALHQNVSPDGVQRAIKANVGVLAGATFDPSRNLISSDPLPSGDESWATNTEIQAVVGDPATATYVSSTCLPFDTVFGAGMHDQLATSSEAELQKLDDLGPFSVAFGGELATVKLGEDRVDAFDRLRIADVMPPTHPEFGLAFDRGVADPAGGRLGYGLARPATAIELTEAQHLPFAVCAD